MPPALLQCFSPSSTVEKEMFFLPENETAAAGVPRGGRCVSLTPS